MKRFKLSIAAVIAVLAMSFTVATKQVKPTFAITEPGCYESISNVTPGDLANNPDESEQFQNFGPTDVTSQTGVLKESPNLTCPADYEVFCCFVVEEIQGQPGEYQVSQIRYKDSSAE